MGAVDGCTVRVMFDVRCVWEREAGWEGERERLVEWWVMWLGGRCWLLVGGFVGG